MRKSLVVFFLFFISALLFSEVIILEKGEKIVGKIIKMDEDTITVLTQKEEMVFDRDKIKSIFRTEDDYNDSLKKEVKNETKNKEPSDGNLIKNGNFTNDSYWKIWGTTATYSKYSIVNATAHIEINEYFENSYIEFYQDNLYLEKNTLYIIKFQAKASPNIDIKVIMKQMDGKNNTYFEKKIILTDNMKEFEYSFRMKNVLDPNVGLFFEFKFEKCKIYIDNVEIKKKL